ncbi:MAG: hypothetical protein E6I35_01580, partial [Chloroflexi bacterium]
MKRALAAAALVGAMLSLQLTTAGATTPNPCPTPAVASASRVTCPTAQVDPNQAAYELLKARLGGDVARALGAAQQLTATLNQFAAIEGILTADVAREEALIADLEAQIARL